MFYAAAAATVLVVILHVLFMLMETVGWKKMGRGMGLSREEVQTTKVLAANQGIYNGALAGVLLWALLSGNIAAVVALLVFVVVVGIFGAATAKWTILLIQSVPAALAIALHVASWYL